MTKPGLWNIKYRARQGVKHMEVEAETYEEAEECFLLNRIDLNEFGVVLSIKPADDTGVLIG